ncbi:hypothetical protein [Sulfitobacter phage vB_SupP_AX]|nr:hypothetical protein [Sulfitobacter phage vB_SupP_AX]
MTAFHIRAEKSGSRNRDDLRVFMAGSILLILILMLQAPAMKFFDNYFAERPFVQAIVQVYHVEGRERPMIYYDADATQSVRGEWRATLHSFAEDNARIATRRGQGSYTNKEDEGKLWTWGAWFESDSEYGPPDVPNEIFRACVYYEVRAQDSASFDESSEAFCSDWYDPENPTMVPEVFPQLGDE